MYQYSESALGLDSHKSLSPPVIFRMEKTMVAKVISELKSVSELEIFPEIGNWSANIYTLHK